MTPKQARYRMRKSRAIRPAKGGASAGWYYVEDGGIFVLCARVQSGITQVRLTWKQIEQALALKRAASSAS
jgi:hypothetical protein